MTIATLLFALTALPASQAGSREPVMLDFTATWCGPCQQVRPAVEQLIQKGYRIKPVDIDTSPRMAEKYDIHSVPTFVVIDPADGRELGRTEGNQPASALAGLYNEGKARLKPQATEPDTDGQVAGESGEDDGEAEDDGEGRGRVASTARPNPNPWETVVRIKVHGNGSIGFGSGTVIHSTPQESLILTCAHIFKMDGRSQAPPSRFPLKITIDLFDGNLGGPKKNQVRYANETVDGQAVDYDFSRDVGLIRIRPGRRLPYAKVVPPHWTPRSRMGMMTVGCSEGHDATAWKTVIVNPAMKGLNGNGAYEAIECMVAPKQGRSGGGLFTDNGYVAGVCDFAEPRGNHGLYAAPASIYSMLDRNKLTTLYAPDRAKPETLLANNRPAPRAKAGRTNGTYARAQSPERDEPGDVTLPPPGMLGIEPPVVARNERRAASLNGKRSTWHATPAGLKMDPSADTDRFASIEPGTAAEPETGGAAGSRDETEPEPVKPSPRKSSSVSWRASRTAVPELSPAGAR